MTQRIPCLTNERSAFSFQNSFIIQVLKMHSQFRRKKQQEIVPARNWRTFLVNLFRLLFPFNRENRRERQNRNAGRSEKGNLEWQIHNRLINIQQRRHSWIRVFSFNNGLQFALNHTMHIDQESESKSCSWNEFDCIAHWRIFYKHNFRSSFAFLGRRKRCHFVDIKQREKKMVISQSEFTRAQSMEGDRRWRQFIQVENTMTLNKRTQRGFHVGKGNFVFKQRMSCSAWINRHRWIYFIRCEIRSRFSLLLCLARCPLLWRRCERRWACRLSWP